MLNVHILCVKIVMREWCLWMWLRLACRLCKGKFWLQSYQLLVDDIKIYLFNTDFYSCFCQLFWLKIALLGNVGFGFEKLYNDDKFVIKIIPISVLFFLFWFMKKHHWTICASSFPVQRFADEHSRRELNCFTLTDEARMMPLIACYH